MPLKLLNINYTKSYVFRFKVANGFIHCASLELMKLQWKVLDLPKVVELKVS
jgi:hypothetical protein